MPIKPGNRVADTAVLWSSVGMKRQSKIMIGILAMGLLGALGTGCATGASGSAGDWRWAPPARLAGGNAGSSSAVIVAPGRANSQFLAYANDQTAEYYRRDDDLNIRTSDPYAGWLAWPEEQLTSLYDQQYFSTNRSPYRYTYPAVRNDRYGRRRGHGRRYR